MAGAFVRWDQFMEGSPSQDGKEVSERGAFAPVVEYDDGSHAFGLPGLITEPWMAMKRWLGGGGEEQVARMRTGLPFSPEAVGDALTIGGSAALGGVASPKPAGSIGTFGGKMARTADREALAKAEQMAAEGASRDDIWSQTGWFKGVDDKWRFEIDDFGDYVKGEGALYRPGKVRSEIIEQGARPEDLERTGYQTLLGDVYDHPELFKAYPDLSRAAWASVPADKLKLPGYGGVWMGQKKGMQINQNIAPSLQSGRSVTLHEAQHGIQDVEGFARGTNQGAANPYIQRHNELDDMITVYNRHELLGESLDDAVNRVAHVRGWQPDALRYALQTHGSKEQIQAAQKALWEANGKTVSPSEWYRRHAGEAESRLVEKRMNMTADERRARAPWLDYDVPESEQIVRFSDGTAMSVSDEPKGAFGAALGSVAAPKPQGAYVTSGAGTNPKVLSAQRRAENVPFDDKLVVQHNLSGQNFMHNDANYGGSIPVPSLAVVKAGNPLTNFGDIALFGSPEMAIPSGKNPIYPADAYTKRRPNVVRDVPKSKDADRLYEALTGEKGKGYKLDLKDPVWDESFRLAFLRSQGKQPPDGVDPYNWARNAIDYRERDALEKFVADWLSENKASIRERIDLGWSDSGERRIYKPHTIDNMVKAMRGRAGGEDFDYGPTSWRANVMRPFGSLAEIQANRGAISKVSKDEMDKFRADLYDPGHALAKALGYRDTDPGMIREGLYSRDPEIAGMARDLKSRLEKLPTEYFEGKPQRAVGLDEFKLAAVPDTMPDVAERLGAFGLDVRPYTRGDDPGAAISSILRTRPDLLFANPKEAAALYGAFALSDKPEIK